MLAHTAVDHGNTDSAAVQALVPRGGRIRYSGRDVERRIDGPIGGDEDHIWIARQIPYRARGQVCIVIRIDQFQGGFQAAPMVADPLEARRFVHLCRVVSPILNDHLDAVLVQIQIVRYFRFELRQNG